MIPARANSNDPRTPTALAPSAGLPGGPARGERLLASDQFMLALGAHVTKIGCRARQVLIIFDNRIRLLSHEISTRVNAVYPSGADRSVRRILSPDIVGSFANAAY